MKPYAITLEVGTSLLNRTGSWRNAKPVYVERLPPCNNACPAGENTQKWLFLAEEGRYEEAWRQIMEDNPFPALMGRVCYHLCEASCNRGQLDESVGINAVERFLGDQALRYCWSITPQESTGKKVLVVGAGPAGLSAAYHLRKLGHEVVVCEAASRAGGMLRYCIPKYRLPREKLNAEIARIEKMGVTIKYDTRITDVAAAMKEGGFDAVFLGVGAHLPKHLGLPVTGAPKILDGISVLKELEEDRPTPIHGRVVVHGGGNTAMDVARSALRLGALETTVVVRRTRDRMAAHDVEVKEAIYEGVKFLYERSISRIDGASVTLEKMIAAEDGRPQPTGQFEVIEADVVVQAVGQDPDLDFIRDIQGISIVSSNVLVDSGMMTGAKGIFAGGDMVPSDRTVTTAIGHGKKAARNIDACLRGESYVKPPQKEVATYDKLNTWYYSDAEKTVRPTLDLIRRQSGFAEVVGDLDEEHAAYEARRCLSCGNCFECDNCYGFCPDNAIVKKGFGKGFEFKYDYCKGCGICPSECPCGAIKMETEKI
ncbi:FAD-dependent oxidoreductase [bacterium]|nr:MAG: FAD-dependent oxidoreductase [bacterium]